MAILDAKYIQSTQYHWTVHWIPATTGHHLHQLQKSIWQHTLRSTGNIARSYDIPDCHLIFSRATTRTLAAAWKMTMAPLISSALTPAWSKLYPVTILFSPSYFVMKKSVSRVNVDIPWKNQIQLTDVDFADTTLIAETRECRTWLPSWNQKLAKSG